MFSLMLMGVYLREAVHLPDRVWQVFLIFSYDRLQIALIYSHLPPFLQLTIL